MVYAPYTGKPEEEKENFWNEMFHLVSCIPQDEMVVNGHVGSSNVGYDGTQVGYGYGDRKGDVSKILEFVYGLNLVMCNILFTKQESKMVTYAAGPVKVWLIILLCDRRTKQRFIMSRSFQMKNVYQSINC